MAARHVRASRRVGASSARSATRILRSGAQASLISSNFFSVHPSRPTRNQLITQRAPIPRVERMVERYTCRVSRATRDVRVECSLLSGSGGGGGGGGGVHTAYAVLDLVSNSAAKIDLEQRFTLAWRRESEAMVTRKAKKEVTNGTAVADMQARAPRLRS